MDRFGMTERSRHQFGFGSGDRRCGSWILDTRRCWSRCSSGGAIVGTGQSNLLKLRRHAASTAVAAWVLRVGLVVLRLVLGDDVLLHAGRRWVVLVVLHLTLWRWGTVWMIVMHDAVVLLLL